MDAVDDQDEDVFDIRFGRAGRVSLPDDGFNARVRDPALIVTHEEALSIMAEMADSIAEITVQIETFNWQTDGMEILPEAQVWRARAAYVRSRKRQDFKRVFLRDQEIRNIRKIEDAVRVQLAATQLSKKNPAVHVAREERLKVEAEVRRQMAAMKHAAYMQAQSLRAEEVRTKREHAADMWAQSLRAKLFQEVAHELLAPDVFQSLFDEMKRRRKQQIEKGTA